MQKIQLKDLEPLSAIDPYVKLNPPVNSSLYSYLEWNPF